MMGRSPVDDAERQAELGRVVGAHDEVLGVRDRPVELVEAQHRVRRQEEQAARARAQIRPQPQILRVRENGMWLVDHRRAWQMKRNRFDLSRPNADHGSPGRGDQQHRVEGHADGEPRL